MKKIHVALPSATRRVLGGLLIAAAATGLTGCGEDPDPQSDEVRTATGADGAEFSNADELRNRLVEEGFPCRESDEEDVEGRTLSKCESGVLLAVFDRAEDADAAAERYVADDKHVLQDEKWIVVDFQEESRLADYQDALGGTIVDG